jgi:hypothetical protein
MVMKKGLYLNSERKGFEYRKPTLKEWVRKIEVYILAGCIFPFFYLGKFLRWLFNVVFFETRKTGNNGIFGPGFRSYYETKFSWGKLSFVILILIVLLFLFFSFLTNYLIFNL